MRSFNVFTCLIFGICYFQSSCTANIRNGNEQTIPENHQSVVEEVIRADSMAANSDSGKRFSLQNGLILKIEGHSAIIVNERGVTVSQNDHLIRMPDDNKECPADGFRNVTVKGDFFTIEQQNCGGWLFIDEYITFRINKADGKFLLHKVGFSYSDRQDPDKTIPDDILTKKEFGTLYFNQITLDSLYSLRRHGNRKK